MKYHDLAAILAYEPRLNSLWLQKKRAQREKKSSVSGKLRVGNDWNAINIIALSQTNPLKAVAEFIENSIDANARNITITRGRERGESYLRIIDDGDGADRDTHNILNFQQPRPEFADVVTYLL